MMRPAIAISETVNGVTTTYVVNNVNEYTSSTTAGVMTGYQYDANGNLIEQTTGSSTTAYSFNVLNQLTAVNGPGLSANCGYDALGNRVTQAINGVTTHFQIDPTGLGNVVASFDASGTLTGHYTYGFGLVSQVSAAGTAGYYDFNNIGSTVGITGSSGSYVNKYAYQPFGQTTTIAAAESNPFTFVGQFGVQAESTGLLNMRARSFDPNSGNFASRDPLGLHGGDFNLQRYVSNDPVNSIDPTGLWCIIRGEFEKGGPNNFLGVSLGSSLGTFGGISSGGFAGVGYSVGPSFGLGLTELGVSLVSIGPSVGVGTSFGFSYGVSHGASIGFSHGTSVGYGAGIGWGGNCPCHCPPTNPPTPSGGPCTLDLGGIAFYLCDNKPVTFEFISPLNIPFRDCDAEAVQMALSGFVGGGEVAGSAGGAVSPGVQVTSICDPQLNNELQQTAQAQSDASDPPINTVPAVAGTDAAAKAAGPPTNDAAVTFIGTALGNLGLLNGQSGNDGYTPAQAVQMASTIATFDQTEADLAGIFATAAGQGASLGITGEINLLKIIDARLEAVTTAENLPFGGDANWLETQQVATLQQWLTAFFADAQVSSDGSISAADTTQLLATTLPSNLSISEATEFINRWNQTVQYWSQGIYTISQVPTGQSTDFLDVGAIQTAFNAAVTAEQESQVDGYSDVGAEVIANLNQVENDLAGQGVCATVKLQIDQTATLTRSAFIGTLTLTNSEGTGALSNVVMNITITDAQGNPANGEFYISSPSYSGDFSVVNGEATLPDNSTGAMAFTFIPDISAAPSAPTLYRIGGTIGFIDPAGGAVSIPVFPATITALPQAQLQINYFLQQTVIGDDPFTPRTEPSEPAVLGMLVTNVGGGTANNLSLATAQPKIVQNDKGLLVNIQIIGTQVGAQQVTPSLNVDFGNIAPGQTADADFLLLSSLQGTFIDFTASFTHSDVLGGVATSLIQSVQTHTLIHAGDFLFPGSTGEIDYLAEENANPGNLPDTIFFSNRTTAPVNLASNESSSQVAADTYTVTASVTSGWDYLQLPDPGAGYTLSKVVRSDGTVIPVGDDAWTTDRTISSTGRSTVANVLHILDLDSTGSYTVYYVPAGQTPPSSSVTALPGLDPGSFTVRWSGTEGTGGSIAGYNIYVSDNGGPFTSWLSADTQTSATFAGVNGHTYGFYSVATDSAGLIQSLPAGAQATTTVDSIPPTSTVTMLSAFSPASFTVRWSGNDGNGSGIASYDVYVSDDGGVFTLWQHNNTQTSAVYTGADGHTYGFYSIASDNVGNVQATPSTAQAMTTVDTIAPTSTVAALPAFGPGSFTVSWSGSDNVGGSGLATYSVFVSDNGGTFQPLETNTTQTSTTFTGVNGHSYGFSTIATDNVGNVQTAPSSAQATITVDAVAPTSTVVALPAFSPSSFTVSWSGSDNVGSSGLANYSVFVSDDGGTAKPIETNTTQTSTTFNGEDGHRYAFFSIATDNADNIETTPTAPQATTTVDGIAPASHVNPLPAFSMPTFTVSWSGADNSGGSGLADYDVYLSDDGGNWVRWQNQTTQTSASFNGQPGHSYAFYSLATDVAGNVENKPAIAEALTETPVLQATLSEPANASAPPTQHVSSLLGMAYHDDDKHTAPGIAVFDTSGNGTWQYSTNGKSWTNIAVVSSTSALLLPQVDQLRFLPSGLGTTPASLYYLAWDGSAGTAGRYANVSNTGGGTPFSSSFGTLDVTLSAVTQAPVWTASTTTLAPVLPGDTNSPGQTVQQAFGDLFSGDNGQAPGIAIVGLSALKAQGTWQFALYDTATQTVGAFQTMPKVSASAALLLGAQDMIRFVPAGNFTGVVSLQVRAWDGNSGKSGDTPNLSKSTSVGGKTAFGSTILTAKLYVNHAPTQNPPANGITLASVAENTASKPVSAATLLSAKESHAADLDKATSLGLAITGNSGPGTWQYELPGGVWQNVPATLSDASVLLLPGAALLLRSGRESVGQCHAQLGCLGWKRGDQRDQWLHGVRHRRRDGLQQHQRHRDAEDHTQPTCPGAGVERQRCGTDSRGSQHDASRRYGKQRLRRLLRGAPRDGGHRRDWRDGHREW